MEFAGLVEVDAYQVVLAFDEILTNVYKHAYQSRPGPVRCDAWIDLTSLRFVDHALGRRTEFGSEYSAIAGRFKARRLRIAIRPQGFR